MTRYVLLGDQSPETHGWKKRASQVFILHVPLPRTLYCRPHHPKLIKKTKSELLCLVTVISYWSEVQPVTYQPVHFREHYFTNEENESQEVN